MDIDEALKEVEAIHAAFDELVSHGKPLGLTHVTVSVDGLVELQKRIDQLHKDLREAWGVSRSDSDTARTA